MNQAADIIWTLSGPGPYNDLIGQRRWHGRDYERWLAGHLEFALLPPEDR